MNDKPGICPKCGHQMKKVLFGNRTAIGIFLTADLLFFFGIIFSIVVPGAGLVAGIIFILIGIWLLYKIQKGWKCLKCDEVVPECRIK